MDASLYKTICIFKGLEAKFENATSLDNKLPRAGFEPATYPLGGDRAIQLCHRGVGQMVARIEHKLKSRPRLCIMHDLHLAFQPFLSELQCTP